MITTEKLVFETKSKKLSILLKTYFLLMIYSNIRIVSRLLNIIIITIIIIIIFIVVIIIIIIIIKILCKIPKPI